MNKKGTKDVTRELPITEPSNYIEGPLDTISYDELVKELTGLTLEEIYSDCDRGDKYDR
jgi:hypothetical protein